MLKKASEGGLQCELPNGFVDVQKCGNDACFNYQSCEMEDSPTPFKTMGPVQVGWLVGWLVGWSFIHGGGRSAGSRGSERAGAV